MKKLILFLALVFVPVTASAQQQDVPRADVKPTAEQAAKNEETFRRLRQPDDEGLEKILDKKFQVPTPDIFVGWKIAMWGLSVAGLLVGLFVAGVIVVLALRFLRKFALPAVGVPDATPALLQVFDNIQQKIQNKAKELEIEKAEIDKRIKAANKKATDE